MHRADLSRMQGHLRLHLLSNLALATYNMASILANLPCLALRLVLHRCLPSSSLPTPVFQLARSQDPKVGPSISCLILTALIVVACLPSASMQFLRALPHQETSTYVAPLHTICRVPFPLAQPRLAPITYRIPYPASAVAPTQMARSTSPCKSAQSLVPFPRQILMLHLI